MAFDDTLAERMRKQLADQDGLVEKRCSAAWHF